MGYSEWEDLAGVGGHGREHELAMEQPSPYPEEVRKCWPVDDELEMVEEARKAMGVEDGKENQDLPLA